MYKNQIMGIIVVCCIVILLLFPIDAYATKKDIYEFEGYGTQYDPYLIMSYDDICALRDIVDSGNALADVWFKQTENIVFPSDKLWDPIGDLKAGIAFSGYYDGNGHTISNIYCENQYAGLFSYLDGEVRNLGIESGIFKGDTIGSITSHGTKNASVINCYNKADVIGNARAGGITDNFPGYILFCWNLGKVTGTREETFTAGICSYEGPQIIYCYDMGTDKLVNDATFSGRIIGSNVLTEINAERMMKQMYKQMYKVYSDGGILWDKNKDISIMRGNIIFMRWSNASLAFDSRYEPDIFSSEKEKNRMDFISLYNARFDFDGEGTATNPFQIKNFEELSHLRDCVNIGVTYRDYYFEQTEDIDFPDGVTWSPIGSVKKLMPFSGTYDGKGHVILNIYCEDEYAGLFSYLNGEVRNLGIESGAFQGVTVGSISSHGTSEACIINCYNKATVIGSARAGGIADNLGGGKILLSWNLGNVSGTKENTIVAGISSYQFADIEDCYSISGDSVVSKLIFRGTSKHSKIIKRDDIDMYLKQNYHNIISYINDNEISTNEFVFMVSEEGDLYFDKTYIPLVGLECIIYKYILIIILACFGILFGFISLIEIGCKNTSSCMKEEVI